ncbi:methyltransferase CmcJ [Ilyonectria robusta]|uniref:methyltransferase CmcJ n=1 Tax=Ilyonectria robusta TaxID=1079257 RepID=UPI001E8E975A|nr:methyltransferase CmcJ [Ilyonectria robusta]KAH8722309.1 methyltransferase CmcJ [Ilyonectria robusta]
MALEIKVSIKFLEWQELYERERPFHIFVDIPPEADDLRRSNLVFAPHDVTLSDTRPFKDTYQLNQHGFTYRDVTDQVLSFSDFSDQSEVEKHYLPMMEDFLRCHVDGVDKVFFFDWRLRMAMGSYTSDTLDLSDLTQWLLPVDQAHIDQSPVAVVNRVIRQLPEDAHALLQGRVRVINIWRPLFHTVEECPLAVRDGSTVESQDKVETDHVRRHYIGSTIFLQHNTRQQWHWLSNQSPNEAILMKMFDSETHPAIDCPHSSFEYQSSPNCLPRQSIEVRALVFTLKSD